MKKECYKVNWSENAQSTLTPGILQIIDCLLEIARTARVYVNHDSPKGSILLPLDVKKSELVSALDALDKAL